MILFRTLAGVPVQPAPRKLGDDFLATLEAALEDLWLRCPWGRATQIVHMGAYVDRPDPNRTDRHAQGRAIDIGAIHWDDLVVRADGPGRSAPEFRRYLAVTAVFEWHIGCTLNYWQPDGKHRSHWHLDDHRAPGWSPSWRPSVRFLQAALHEIWQHDDVTIDGVYGPRTQGAAQAAGLDPAGNWDSVLAEIARRGFEGH